VPTASGLSARIDGVVLPESEPIDFVVTAKIEENPGSAASLERHPS
jgi:hypothetical protein